MTAEYVTLAMVRELIETQERAFKQTIGLYTNSVGEEVKSMRKTVGDKRDVFHKKILMI